MLPFVAHASPASESWTWEIFVVPPDSGWDTVEGETIRATLGWFEKNINQDPFGLLEHDARFVYMEKPITEESLSGDVTVLKALKGSRCIAVLNFASDEINSLLVPALGNAGVPMLLTEGEEVWLLDGALAYPYIFALSLYRDYRTLAFADYIKKTFNPSVTNRISMIASRFSLNEEREAKMCADLLGKLGIQPIAFWTDASNFNTFRLLESEVKASLSGILLCYVGSMAAREIWRGVKGLESQYQLWYAGAPSESFLSYSGMLFADQSMKLKEEGGFVATKRKLWVSRAVDVKDEVVGGKAFALATWLIESVKKAGRADADVLVHALATAAQVPFGSQMLDISPRTHRPRERDVYIMRVMNGEYDLIDVLKILTERDGLQ